VLPDVTVLLDEISPINGALHVLVRPREHPYGDSVLHRDRSVEVDAESRQSVASLSALSPISDGMLCGRILPGGLSKCRGSGDAVAPGETEYRLASMRNTGRRGAFGRVLTTSSTLMRALLVATIS